MSRRDNLIAELKQIEEKRGRPLPEGIEYLPIKELEEYIIKMREIFGRKA